MTSQGGHPGEGARRDRAIGTAAAAHARPSLRRTTIALVAAAHPGPSAAVTVLSTVVAVLAGISAARAGLVAAAVMAGQLSIGWSNDLVDAGRDRANARSDKPVASGRVSAQAVATATALALALCVPLSLSLGVLPGLAHLVAVAGGWVYNLGVKRTVVSFVPYGVSFALLPVFLVRAAGAHPPGWLAVAGGLLGMGAHLFNALPDIPDDRATGVHGLPVVLGAAGTRAVGSLLLAGAAALIVMAPAGSPGPVSWATLGASLALACTAAALGPRAGARAPFRLAVIVATVDVLLLAQRTASLG